MPVLHKAYPLISVSDKVAGQSYVFMSRQTRTFPFASFWAKLTRHCYRRQNNTSKLPQKGKCTETFPPKKVKAVTLVKPGQIERTGNVDHKPCRSIRPAGISVKGPVTKQTLCNDKEKKNKTKLKTVFCPEICNKLKIKNACVSFLKILLY